MMQKGDYIGCRSCRKPFQTEGSTLCPDCREKIRKRREARGRDLQNSGGNMALYYARTEAGLSRKRLAKLAGVSESTYSKCESGQGDLSEPNRARVARVLRKPVEALWEHPYRVRCRNCKAWFHPIRDEKNCPACQKDARREAEGHVRRLTGTSQHLLSMDCRKAKEAGYGHSYGLWRADQERTQ